MIPIYHLTRKGIPFYWGEEQEKAFKAIKDCLVNPPVLVMPNKKKGPFCTCIWLLVKIACGSCHCIKNKQGRYKLVAYYSKKLPEAVQRYSISELELTGIMANVAAFKHLLRNANFHSLLWSFCISTYNGSKKRVTPHWDWRS